MFKKLVWMSFALSPATNEVAYDFKLPEKKNNWNHKKSVTLGKGQIVYNLLSWPMTNRYVKGIQYMYTIYQDYHRFFAKSIRLCIVRQGL